MLTIDIGSKNIKILCGAAAPKNASATRQILLETPKNAVVNGFVVDFDSVVEVISSAVEQNDVREKKVAVVLTSPDIIIREIKLPKTSTKNIDSIVFNEMESFLSDDDYSVEYFLQYQEDGVVRAYTFGVPARVVENYKKMLTAAGLLPVAMDVSTNCIRKLVSSRNLIQQTGEQRMDVVADTGYNFINFNIFEKKTLVYSRCVKIDVDETIKNHVDTLRGLSRRELELDIDFTAYLSAVGDEIQKVMQFLISSDFRVKDTKLFLCGGVANFDGVTDLMHEYLNMNVNLFEIRRNPTFRDVNLKEFINALGAQIRL